LVSLIAAGFIVTVTAIVPTVGILSPSAKLRALIGTGAFAGFCIAYLMFRRRGERYKNQPIMVLDVEGFWHPRLGKIIPWSKLCLIRMPERKEASSRTYGTIEIPERAGPLPQPRK
jgi:hypothetical protein